MAARVASGEAASTVGRGRRGHGLLDRPARQQALQHDGVVVARRAEPDDVAVVEQRALVSHRAVVDEDPVAALLVDRHGPGRDDDLGVQRADAREREQQARALVRPDRHDAGVGQYAAGARERAAQDRQ